MRARSHADLDRIRASVERTRKLSDKIIGVGPFNLGIDGIVAWIPVVGTLYTLGAGAFLMTQAVRARVSPGTLAKMAGLLTVDTLTDAVPIPFAADVADMMFTAHKWAAEALIKGMDDTVYYPGAKHEAHADPRFHEMMERVRSGRDRRKRVVFLGEADG